MALPPGRGIPVADIVDELPTDHDFREEPDPMPTASELDDKYLDDAAATAVRRMDWLLARGVPDSDVLRDKEGEFYYDANEDEDGRVHYVKRRLPDDITLIF